MLLMEFGDFPMMRRMLRGIRERAEAEYRRHFLRVPDRHRPALLRAAPVAVIGACVGYLVWRVRRA
jgi:hypothetical protein